MKITPIEAMELGIWQIVCDKAGINPWAVNEGLIDPDKEIEVPELIARQLSGSSEPCPS